MSNISGPTGIPPSRSGSESRGPERSKDDSGKKFELKEKDKEKVKEKEEQKEVKIEKKDEGKGEGAAFGEVGQKGAQLGTFETKDAASVKEVKETSQQQRISDVNKMITSMVESVQVGELGENQIASVTLGTGKEVPALLKEAKIGITITEGGTTITIESKSNTELALLMQSEQNKEQLQVLFEKLNIKSLQVGETMINAPAATTAEAKVAAPPPTEQQTRDQRDRGEEREGGRQGQEDQENQQ